MSTIFGSFYKKSPLGFFGVGMGIPVPLNSSNINFSFFKICVLTQSAFIMLCALVCSCAARHAVIIMRKACSIRSFAPGIDSL